MPQSNQCAVEQVSAAPSTHHRRRRQPRKSAPDFDPDLEWFIGCGEAALGARGTLAGVISQCERGSVGGSGTLDAAGSYEHPYTDQQLGFGRVVNGEVERHRWLATAWHATTEKTRNVLLARYTPEAAEFRSDEGFGAQERYLEHEDPWGPAPVQPLGKRGKPVQVRQHEARVARWERSRQRVQSQARRTNIAMQLGELAGLALMLADNPATLMVACHDPDPMQLRKGETVVNRSLQGQRHKTISEALAVALEASLAAHREWRESKDGADPMRTNRERGSGAA